MPTPPAPPAAFLSYVRLDDAHEEGKITTLRQRLEGEVRIQTGCDFTIFQDRRDIRWGQQWRKRLDTSLDATTFLIPIITPSFFNSPACRGEVEHFLKRENELGRDDLILPIYYVQCPQMQDESKREANPVATALHKHQYVDWRDLRHEPLTGADVSRRLAEMAERIRDVLEEFENLPAPVSRVSRNTRTASASYEDALSIVDKVIKASGERKPGGGAASSEPASKTEPLTLIVDPMHRGNFTTIAEAIKAADPGSRLLVRPGLYQEGIVMDKPLEILGDGEPGEVVVQANGCAALVFETIMGRVANLTLRQVGGGNCFGVDITQGRLDLENCDITSESLPCVAVCNGADPRVRGNRIHQGNAGGILIYNHARGTYEDNDINENAGAGISVITHSDPIIRDNRIHNSQWGVVVDAHGRGTFENNDISGNNEIGIAVKSGGDPNVRGNRIQQNGHVGIWVVKKGRGTYVGNDLRDNVGGAWSIAPDCLDLVKRSDNREDDPAENA